MRSKYNNVRFCKEDRYWDSKKEYERWLVLSEMQRKKQIKDLRCQVPFLLADKHKRKDGTVERAAYYRADFCYYTKDDEYVVEDVKGQRTDLYILKRKLMLDKYGIEVTEVH